MDRIMKALAVAFEQHKGQTRKAGGAPYIVHILDVARILLSEPGVSEDVVVAGILHDTLEDTPYTPEQLEHDFGPHVLSLVQFATEPGKGPTTTREEKTRTWRARKEHTIEACAHASRDQLLVLIADKLSNLTSLREELHLHGDAIWTSFNASKEDTTGTTQLYETSSEIDCGTPGCFRFTMRSSRRFSSRVIAGPGSEARSTCREGLCLCIGPGTGGTRIIISHGICAASDPGIGFVAVLDPIRVAEFT